MALIGTLAFLTTCLILVVSLVLVLVSLLGRRTGTAVRAVGLMLAWLALYGIILLAVSLTSRAPVLEQGQEHCFDEMCCSVQGVASTKTLGTSQANGLFYVVDVTLRNAAKRAAQKPSNPELWVTDGVGHEYRQMFWGEGETAGQVANAEQLWNQRLNPGETVEQRVAFDLPVGVLSPQLVIAEGAGFPTTVIIGDENSLLHGKTSFRLNK